MQAWNRSLVSRSLAFAVLCLGVVFWGFGCVGVPSSGPPAPLPSALDAAAQDLRSKAVAAIEGEAPLPVPWTQDSGLRELLCSAHDLGWLAPREAEGLVLAIARELSAMCPADTTRRRTVLEALEAPFEFIGTEEFFAALGNLGGAVPIPYRPPDWTRRAREGVSRFFTSRGVHGNVVWPGKKQVSDLSSGDLRRLASLLTAVHAFAFDPSTGAIAGAVLESGANTPFIHLRTSHDGGTTLYVYPHWREFAGRERLVLALCTSDPPCVFYCVGTWCIAEALQGLGVTRSGHVYEETEPDYPVDEDEE